MQMRRVEHFFQLKWSPSTCLFFSAYAFPSRLVEYLEPVRQAARCRGPSSNDLATSHLACGMTNKRHPYYSDKCPLSPGWQTWLARPAERQIAFENRRPLRCTSLRSVGGNKTHRHGALIMWTADTWDGCSHYHGISCIKAGSLFNNGRVNHASLRGKSMNHVSTLNSCPRVLKSQGSFFPTWFFTFFVWVCHSFFTWLYRMTG